MSEALFRANAYQRSCESKISAIDGQNISLDQTVFYPNGGGQPGDIGTLRTTAGLRVNIIDTRKTETQDIAHIVDGDISSLHVGDTVQVEIDWDRRYRFMRLHSCLHLLSVVLPFGVTGGQISEDKARLDFDMPDPADKETVNQQLNDLIQKNHPMRMEWIAEAQLDAQPELVKTLSVQPPRGQGQIRLIHFEGADVQPCGGTHVNNSSEIGQVKVRKIEKKGKNNRRVIVELVD